MRVLHLFSNCKWTGPAEPALTLCCQLRTQGVETEFACAPDAGNSVNMVVESARTRGIEPILDFHLRKHRHPLHNLQDVRAMRRFLATHPCDLVHCHLDNDHEIAARALRGSPIPLLRSSYEGLGIRVRRRHRRMMGRTQLLLVPSEMARARDAENFGLSQDQIAVVPGAIDTRRFDPARLPKPDRARWCIPDDAYVVGIVARMQTHRHFEDLLEAVRRLVDVMPDAHLLIVGRGTHQKKVVEEPARAMGIADHVHITGYLDGDDFVSAVQAIDTGVYLVPGSDGTCRAARELLAMGKPVVVADRGMLREIVADGSTGVVTDGSVEQLLNALHDLGRDDERRTRYAENARALAETRYALDVQAATVKALYGQILEG